MYPDIHQLKCISTIFDIFQVSLDAYQIFLTEEATSHQSLQHYSFLGLVDIAHKALRNAYQSLS